MRAGPVNGVCPRCAAGFLRATPTEPSVAGERNPGLTPLAPADLAAKFPQLEILAFIGQGGMGAVYKARQRELERVVALKMLPPGTGSDPAFAERFAREAKALAMLNHPGIVTIYDFGRADGLFYLLMEFVDGVSLAELIHQGRVSPREALAIVPQICDALQYAHDQGIVHRDIKPENILLDRRGRVKVADFGLAKLMEHSGKLAVSEAGLAAASPNLTQAGKVMGTPQYMAPEQVEHPAGVDHRADIYALGVVFYQMLTGELPGELIERPSQKVRVDVRLDEVVLRALEKEPERRYQQVSGVKTAVEAIVQAGRPTPARRQGVTLAALAVCSVLCLAALLGWLLKHPKESLTNGLVAYYPFNGNANDAVGTNNGTVYGATLTTDRFGLTNTAYRFNGTSWVQLPDGILPVAALEFTLSVWVLADSRPYTKMGIVGQTSRKGECGISTEGCGVKLQYSGFQNIFTNLMFTNKWSQIVETYRQGQYVQLWVNGSLIQSNAIPDEIMYHEPTFPLNSSIGNYDFAPAPYYGFKGAIDDVRIYNRALSSAEVQRLYAYESDPQVNLKRP
jgi:serine/threonine protein kinase